MKGLFMRTEDDLRVALSARERLTPDSGPVLDGLRQAVQRRRYRLITSSMTAATVVGTAVVTMLAATILLTPATAPPTATPPAHPPGQTPPPTTDVHAADRPDFFFTLAPTTAGGYEIRPTQLAPEQQAALVVPIDGGEAVGVVTLQRPGSMAEAPTDAPNSEVHGAPAWFVDDPFGHMIGTLYWEYAPDALALLNLRFPEIPVATFVAIAEGVAFVDPYPAHLPYRLDFMPADLRPISLGSGRGGGRHALVFANDLGGVEPEDGHPREVTISIVDNRPTPGDMFWPGYTDLPWQSPTRIGAHRVRCAEAPGGLNFDEHQMCEIEVQGDILILDVFELMPAELEQLIAGLTLADLAEPATWFTSADALP